MEGHGRVHHREAWGKGEERRGGKRHHVVGRALEGQHDGEGGESHKLLVVLVEERQLLGRVFAPGRERWGMGVGELTGFDRCFSSPSQPCAPDLPNAHRVNQQVPLRVRHLVGLPFVAHHQIRMDLVLVTHGSWGFVKG